MVASRPTAGPCFRLQRDGATGEHAFAAVAAAAPVDDAANCVRKAVIFRRVYNRTVCVQYDHCRPYDSAGAKAYAKEEEVHRPCVRPFLSGSSCTAGRCTTVVSVFRISRCVRATLHGIQDAMARVATTEKPASTELSCRAVPRLPLHSGNNEKLS